MKSYQSLSGLNILVGKYGGMFARRLNQLLILEGAKVVNMWSPGETTVHAVVIDCRASKKSFNEMLNRLDPSTCAVIILTTPLCKEYELAAKRNLISMRFPRKQFILREIVQPAGYDQNFLLANKICRRLANVFNTVSV